MTMKTFLFLIPLLLVSCASQERLQITSVSVPAAARVDTTSPADMLRDAPKLGGSVRSWSIPIASDGTFELTRQKRDTFVSAYDPPTVKHPSAQPVEYGTKVLGVSATGRVSTASGRREVELSFRDTKKTAVINWGSGVEQPVYHTRSLDTSVVVSPSEWIVLDGPHTPASDPERHFLLVKAP